MMAASGKQNQKKKMNLLQKVCLVLLGVIFSFVILETGLQIASLVLRARLDQPDLEGFEDNDIRILCIGESTTQLGFENSYPHQLAEILNSSSSDKEYIVINKGMSSKESGDILSQLNENLQKYKPHVVISMIGINDRVSSLDSPSKWLGFLQKFRSFKLFSLLGDHLSQRMNKVSKESKDLSEEKQIEHERIEFGEIKVLRKELAKTKLLLLKLQSELVLEKNSGKQKKMRQSLANIQLRKNWLLVVIGRHYRLRGDYNEAEKYLIVGLKDNRNSFGAYLELGRCFKEQGAYEQAIKLFKRAIEIKPDTVLGHAELGRSYRALGWKKELFDLCNEYVDKKLKDVWIYAEMGMWFKNNGFFPYAEKVYLHAIEANPGNPLLYIQIADVYRLQGKKHLADKYYHEGVELSQEIQKYHPITIRNYNEIAKRILFEGIHLICMQYPLRDIEPLRNILWSWSENGITFVENKKDFEKVLRENEYSSYFSDAFAGDFGHCTREGNRLIAQNLANVILKKD